MLNHLAKKGWGLFVNETGNMLNIRVSTNNPQARANIP